MRGKQFSKAFDKLTSKEVSIEVLREGKHFTGSSVLINSRAYLKCIFENQVNE